MNYSYSLLFFALLLQMWSCTPTRETTNYSARKAVDYSANSPVNFDIEDSSKVIYKSYNISFEKTIDNRFVFKKYYPSTSVKTFEITYADEKQNYLEGLFIRRYDNGKIWATGKYTDNRQQGKWEAFHFPGGELKQKSFYNKGLPSGTWTDYNSDSTKWAEYSFNEEGELHGEKTYWNSKGEITKILIYEDGELLKTKTFIGNETGKVLSVVEKMPLFGDQCTDITDKEEALDCSNNNLLKHIYTKIKYPTIARENNIEGTAVISFVVEKDGSITDIAVLNGVCDEIRDECIRVLNTFPTWQPGYQDGEPVRVQFNLPIKFRLE